MVDVYGRPVGGVYGQTVGGLLADAGSDIYGYGQGLLDYIRRRPESAGLIAGQFAPGAATADFYGRYPDPMNPSQMLPSAGQNIAQGNILDAAFQSAGLLGDALYAAAPFTAGAAAIPGAALSAPRAAQLAKRGAKTPKDAEPGIVAYHGSPFDFGEFNLRNINTGEGAQAFGHGLYFTESEDIAKFYKRALTDDLTYDTRYSFKGQEHERGSPEWKMLATVYNEGLPSAKKLLQEFKSDLAKGEPYITADKVERYEAIISQAPKKSEIGKNQGRVYKVGLAPKPNELLDYDKPFGEQNDFIKERLEKVANELNVDDAMNLGFDPFDYGGSDKAAIEAARKSMLDDETPVVRFLNDFAVLRGNLGAGEELLNKHGIKGIKYKANQGVGARNVPETGENNYVIFDDKLVKILEKYGILGPVAVGAATTAGVSGGLLGGEQRQQENQLVPVF